MDIWIYGPRTLRSGHKLKKKNSVRNLRSGRRTRSVGSNDVKSTARSFLERHLKRGH